MKTGRARSKEEMPPEAPPPEGQPAAETPASTSPGAELAAVQAPEARKGLFGNPIMLALIGAAALVACIVILILVLGSRRPKEWVPVSRVTGDWTASVQVFGPQMQLQETWQTDCQRYQGVVRSATCVLQPTGRFNDQPADQYDEFAYNIYYDDTWRRIYQAQGAEFVTATLGTDDRIDGNRRLVSEERLKDDTCQLTEYTIWVDDPQDKTQEIEVYLNDCEVWDHVIVFDAVQAAWCQCEVTTIVPLGQPIAEQGAGLEVAWPQPSLPAGGRGEQSFSGTVTFAGGDYTFSASTTDLAQYQDWLTSPYYLGIRDGRAVSVSKDQGK